MKTQQAIEHRDLVRQMYRRSHWRTALILAVDWLLDRFRTTVNVWGDACGAAVVEQQVMGSQAGRGQIASSGP